MQTSNPIARLTELNAKLGNLVPVPGTSAATKPARLILPLSNLRLKSAQDTELLAKRLAVRGLRR